MHEFSAFQEFYDPKLIITGQHWVTLTSTLNNKNSTSSNNKSNSKNSTSPSKTLSTPSPSNAWRRYIDEVYTQPQVYFGEKCGGMKMLRDELREDINSGEGKKKPPTIEESLSFLSAEVPAGLQLTSLEIYDHQFDEKTGDMMAANNVLLVRFSYQYSPNNPNTNNPDGSIALDLKSLFENDNFGTITKVQELSLSANQLRDLMPTWDNTKPPRTAVDPTTFTTTVGLWEIRTFAIHFLEPPNQQNLISDEGYVVSDENSEILFV